LSDFSDSQAAFNRTDRDHHPKKARRKTMRKLLFCVFVAALSALVPGSALAAQPVITDYTLDVGPIVITDVCSAPIDLSGHLVVRETDYFDAKGSPTRLYLHTVETDTFTGPARALTSDAYTYGTWFTFDANGNIVSGKVAGVIVRVHLPDGSLFLSAGRIVLHPNGPAFNFSPDFGRSGDLSALCRALGA
jgi:hypothetical protein